MNKLKSYIAVFLVIAMMFLSSCSFSEFFDHSILDDPDKGTSDADDYVKNETMAVASFSGEQISPYTSTSRANRDIISLCYDALVSINSDLEAVPQICQTFVQNGNSVVFYIDSSAVFSDGSRITAADCAYSFAKAEAASSVFCNRFSAIYKYEATDTYVFTVTFKNAGIYNVNLTTIPIIKAGSDANGATAIGSGRYILNSDEGGTYLTANANAKNVPATERINVISVDNAEELLYNINYGNVHASYADLSEGNSSFRGTTELMDFTTNDLIFAVVNKNSEYFTSSDAVKGITYAIDRSKIVSNILSSASRSVWYPFNPDWSVTKAADLNADIYSSTTAHEYFTSAGLTLSGTERVWNGQTAEIVILVNQESLIKTKVAESIAEDLEGMSFKVTVKTLKWDEMKQAVLDGEYDIFIGEMNLFPNMDITSITKNELVLSAAQADETGEKGYSEEFLNAVDDFYTGASDMRTFLSAFQEELPFIPLYFSGGALAVNRNIAGTFEPNCFDLYAKAETWTLN